MSETEITEEVRLTCVIDFLQDEGLMVIGHIHCNQERLEWIRNEVKSHRAKRAALQNGAAGAQEAGGEK